MNAKKKLALLLSLVLLVMMLPATVLAEEATAEVVAPPLYLALGDSISFGLTDYDFAESEFDGYTQMFYDDVLEGLGFVHDENLNNLSYPGDTTQDLLNLLNGEDHLEGIYNRVPALQYYLPQADIITISIGSNNLLGPFIAGIAGMYEGIDSVLGDITGAAMLTQLAGAIYSDYHDGDTSTPETKLAALMDPLDDAWHEGTIQFLNDWAVILAKIRKINPDAKIYVNNLYNPLLASKLSSPSFAGFYDLVNKYISKINSQMNRLGKNGRFEYTVVDVYQPFDNVGNFGYLLGSPPNPLTAPVAFNLPLALLTIQSAQSFDEINLPSFIIFCDPHPTTFGHMIITQELVLVAEID